MKFPRIGLAVALAALMAGAPALAQLAAQPDAAVQRAAAAQKQPLLDTLKEFVSIETGSRDIDGLTQASELLATASCAPWAAQVDFIEPTAATTYRMADTPETRSGRMVRATFKGTGSKRILLIAHMDTVYLKGMLAKQPFRIDGNKAYGLGISDDKQGVAMVVHLVALLKSLNFNEYGTLTVLVNGDEEISSPGSREALIGGRRLSTTPCCRSRPPAATTTSCRWPPAALARWRSRWRAARRTPAARPSAASMRCTSCRTRSCRCATCPSRRWG
jgi:glutamate carboxypeptidase